MTGQLDDQLRALVRAPVAASRDGPRHDIAAWVDTAFNGGLTIPRALIDGLGPPQESSIEATLADGRTVALETFGCYLDWFGGTYHTQVVASDGVYPLLGTLLLADRRLAIDYTARTVELDVGSGEPRVVHCFTSRAPGEDSRPLAIKGFRAAARNAQAQQPAAALTKLVALANPIRLLRSAASCLVRRGSARPWHVTLKVSHVAHYVRVRAVQVLSGGCPSHHIPNQSCVWSSRIRDYFRAEPDSSI